MTFSVYETIILKEDIAWIFMHLSFVKKTLPAIKKYT